MTLVLYALLSLYKKDWSNWQWIAFGLINAVTLFFHLQLEGAAKDGLDLSAEGGLISYYFDIVYIGWFVLVAGRLSSCILV